jgi:hypothetical protein
MQDPLVLDPTAHRRAEEKSCCTRSKDPFSSTSSASWRGRWLIPTCWPAS